MYYTALYRKYRPDNFSNIVGQETIVNVLTNSIINNHISHAYLFTGPRGTGKTSTAKIFAHAVNCENFEKDICLKCNTCLSLKENDSDIIEIDAASNNGVDEIRTLRDNVNLMPSFCKYKIYIIDEVHMLSTGAFNALLKTLEEPPSHVIFILATTDPNKIPSTILSRCQRFDFNEISVNKIEERLKFILNKENCILPDEVIKYIAENSKGGLRDAINLLDQTLSLNKYENTCIDDVDKLSGRISRDSVIKLLNSLINAEYSQILDSINKYCEEGKNLLDVVNSLLTLLRDISINNQVKNYFPGNISDELNKILIKNEEIIKISKILNELTNDLKFSNNQKIIFEINMLNISQIINENKNTLVENITYKQEVKKNDISKENGILEKNDDINLKELDTKIADLKNIRINNVLAEANKDILNNILENYDIIYDYSSNKKYNSLVEILKESKPVVASNKYIMLIFKEEKVEKLFDNNYKLIEIFFKEIFNNEYKVVGVIDQKWEKIKKEFIQNRKNNIKYEFIEETEVEKKIENTKMSDLEKSALDIFGDSSVSIK